MTKTTNFLETFLIMLLLVGLVLSACFYSKSTYIAEAMTKEPAPNYINKPIIKAAIATVESKPDMDDMLTREEIELIALVVMAEAEGQPEEGKRLVIDTILNRLDSNRFPNTVEGIIYQKNQFSSMWNGRSDRCYVKEDICQLVVQELATRTNSDVVFFRADFYHDFGTPVMQVGDHYFSTF